MNESVSQTANPFFAVDEIGSIQIEPCSPNIYQQYVYGNAPFEIPQFYSGDEVIRYMVPHTSDNRFLILCPNNGNISLNKISGRSVDSCTQTAQVQTDIQTTDFETPDQAPTGK